jgi:hypothetical protein
MFPASSIDRALLRRTLVQLVLYSASVFTDMNVGASQMLHDFVNMPLIRTSAHFQIRTLVNYLLISSIAFLITGSYVLATSKYPSSLQACRPNMAFVLRNNNCLSFSGIVFRLIVSFAA